MEETKEVGVVSGPTAHPDAQFAVWAAKNDTHTKYWMISVRISEKCRVVCGSTPCNPAWMEAWQSVTG